MGNEMLIVWLLAQALIELVLCGGILYLLYGGKNKKEEVILEAEKLKRLMFMGSRVVNRHHTMSELLKKVGEGGAALEACMSGRDRRHRTVAGASGISKHLPGQRGISSYERTAHLLEKGIPVGEISKQVGLPRGEVELIMNLRKH